ncbi:MAG TPA: TIGR03435 family protein, partial [Bryobacteraceae bacterium]|nr:TIGR03435 family protein [Bryobacteraceae bacterium]
DRIVGGPSWVEMDRFDIVAKMPDDADSAAGNEMLKTLLADRFKLVTHEDKQPMPGYALNAGKKPSMKPGDDSGDTGCRIQQHDAPAGPGNGVLMMSMNGQPTRIALGAGGVIEYACRNMTMDSFVQGLRTMVGTGVGNKTVLNQTDLPGKWDFNLRYSIMMGGNSPDRITFNDAVEKQLGMKMSEISVPTQVVMIDSVERKPAPNPPGTAEAIPPAPKAPAAFDAASIRPSDSAQMGGMTSFRGNRYTAQNVVLSTLVIQAFRTSPALMFNGDAVVGLPPFANSARFDISATTSLAEGGAAEMAPMMRSLLEERFKMKWHNEERPMNAYTLVAVKPKMKKADPASRSHCIRAAGPAGSPPGTQTMTCQNIGMDDFVDQLMGAAPGLNWPVQNSTGLEGGWDFTLTYGRGPVPMMAAAAQAGGGEGRGGPVAEASDPSGSLTLFEAVEKQLGLKLEMQKRSEPVVVIDHLEEKPTEN